MGKNIVVYSDGTGQDGGVRPDQRLSNVYKMYRASRIGPDSPIDPALQVAFYDPGLGTDDDARGLGRAWRTVGKFLASVAGRGIGNNIADCYEFILNHWSPGDRIYIVGFSRGAYTARCVAQVLALCGVPAHEPGQTGMPLRRFARSTRLAAERAVHEVYEHGAGHPAEDFADERAEQARRFRSDFGSADADPYFVGVFDTVAALGAKGWKYVGLIMLFAVAASLLTAAAAGLMAAAGVPFGTAWPMLMVATGLAVCLVSWRGSRRFIDHFPEASSPRRTHHVSWRAENYDRGLSMNVGYARQASAIDEDRADFPRVGWGHSQRIRPAVEGEPEPFVQLWFAGNHSDIGGSYEEPESRLSDVALEWMVGEAESLPHPLLFDQSRLALWPDHAGMQHSELFSLQDRRLWWLPRFLPEALRRGWEPGARRPAGSPLHPSVFARFATPTVVRPDGTGPYRPAPLESDARLERYYSAGEPRRERSAAPAARLSVEGLEYRLQDPTDVGRLLAALKTEEASVVCPGLMVTERSRYRDALGLEYLDRMLQAAGRSALPVSLGSVGDGSDALAGRLLLGVNGQDAAHLAISVGAPAILVLKDEGAELWTDDLPGFA